jgi:hypothetical protein
MGKPADGQPLLHHLDALSLSIKELYTFHCLEGQGEFLLRHEKTARQGGGLRVGAFAYRYVPP